MLDKFKKYYSKHPIVVIGGVIISILSVIVLIYSFINLFVDLYVNYNGLDIGTQILSMAVVIVIINVILIALVSLYLSAKIDDLSDKLNLKNVKDKKK